MSNTGLEERDAAADAVAKAPRVTLDQIKTLIAGERYFVDETLTICVLTLTNGYKVTGESAAADPANFNEELGRKIAKDKAVAEIWPLAGFLLRDTLHRGERPPVVRAKMACQGVAPIAWTYKPGVVVTLNAVYANSDGTRNAENQAFSEATPSANLQMHITNPAAVDRFVQGQAYYVDFTPSD